MKRQFQVVALCTLFAILGCAKRESIAPEAVESKDSQQYDGLPLRGLNELATRVHLTRDAEDMLGFFGSLPLEMDIQERIETGNGKPAILLMRDRLQGGGKIPTLCILVDYAHGGSCVRLTVVNATQILWSTEEQFFGNWAEGQKWIVSTFVDEWKSQNR